MTLDVVRHVLTLAATRDYDPTTIVRLILTIVLIAIAGPALARTNRHLLRGIKLLHDMEDARALAELQRALRAAGSNRAEGARVHVYIGIAQVNLLHTDEARASFREALTLDREAELPAMTSPKIQQLFESVREELEAAKPKPPPPAPGERPQPRPSPPPPAPRPAAQPGPRLESPSPSRSGGASRYWPAFSTAGLAAGAGIAGLVCGVLSRSSADKAKDISLPYAAARQHHDDARTRALAANIMFGVAGAAAVTSGVLFWILAKRRPEARAAHAALAPSPSGLSVQLRTTW